MDIIDTPPIELDWNRIENVFLDMDGTLLDLHFDNYFWLEHLPRRYGESRGLPLDSARAELHERYQRLRGTLEWYCIDYWTRELALDIAGLKHEVAGLIAIRPHVQDFLDALGAAGKQRILVTNAHPGSLALKMERTGLAGNFERIICSHHLQAPKERPEFWQRLQQIEPFDPQRTLLIDDSLSVLQAAQDYGVQSLLTMLQPDSTAPCRTPKGFPGIVHFNEILPGLLAEAVPGV